MAFEKSLPIASTGDIAARRIVMVISRMLLSSAPPTTASVMASTASCRESATLQCLARVVCGGLRHRPRVVLGLYRRPPSRGDKSFGHLDRGASRVALDHRTHTATSR